MSISPAVKSPVVIIMIHLWVGYISIKRVSGQVHFFVLLVIIENISVNSELLKTEKFQTMKIDTDEDEHSIEMHLPYVYLTFLGSADSPPFLRPFSSPLV